MNRANELAARVAKIITDATNGKRRFTVAIDGRCASGKTTLARALERRVGCAVIHMDHFFLRPEQRTSERLATAGGNVDRERMLEEVLAPLSRGDSVTYRPFDCGSMTLGSPIAIPDAQIYIVEGSYSCHPALRDCYDLKIFLTVSPEEQMRRIIIRNGERAAEVFLSRWIPLEEKYFSELSVASACDHIFET